METQSFDEFLAEIVEVDTRTPAMINEAQENIRQLIDGYFKSVIKLNKAALEYALSSRDKTVVTTDGKWVVRGSPPSWRNSFLEFHESSNFMKNGNAKSYIIYAGNSNENGGSLLLASFVNDALEEAKGDVSKMFDTFVKNQKAKIFPQGEYEAIISSTPNKDGIRLNPYVLVKNIKPFTKTLVNNLKIRKDDIIKMVVNGQISDITVGHHLTDDYHYDGSGRKLDPLWFLTKDVFNSRKPYISLYVNDDADAYISFSVHSNYNVNLTVDPKKVKIEAAKPKM